MATILFDKIVFGPIYSRRLGVSLGINLLPSNCKTCNYNCIYCECGNSFDKKIEYDKMPPREYVKNALYQELEEMAANDNDPDTITFTGNGEPTLHPEFEGIIDDTIEVRDLFFPSAKIAVLSNSTNIDNQTVRRALSKVDKAILKLDSASNDTILLHNRPSKYIDTSQLITLLAALKFDIIIQTMFIQGSINGTEINNTGEKDISDWLDALKIIKPSEVQIYTISRDTPDGAILSKISPEILNSIAERVEKLGIKTLVSA